MRKEETRMYVATPGGLAADAAVAINTREDVRTGIAGAASTATSAAVGARPVAGFVATTL